MAQYEVAVLYHPDLEVDLTKAEEKVTKIFTSNGGKVAGTDNWGKKKLAYRIKGEDFAVYVALNVELPAEAPLKVSNTLNITDEVLRYLLVKVDHKGRAALEDAKKRAAERGDNTEDSEEN